MNLTQLSRTLSYALRHEPWVYELELDDEGWVRVEALIAALKESRSKWNDLTEDHIRRMMATADIILRDGLKPMVRQYVHLSADRETAEQVGQRKAGKPVILRVRAAEAAAQGVPFYVGNNKVWLADTVPGEIIDL